MPKPALDTYWVGQIYSMLENEPGITDGVIAQRLEARAKREDRDDYPMQRTVNKYRHTWEGMDAAERARYRFFRWPDSLVCGDLPWEACDAALELLRETDRHLQMYTAPSVRVARHFYYVTRAAPGAPLLDRLHLTAMLLVAEATGDRETKLAIQGLLAYAPWRGQKYAAWYRKAVSRPEHPVPKLPQGPLLLHPPGLGDGEREFLTMVNIVQMDADNGRKKEGRREGSHRPTAEGDGQQGEAAEGEGL